MNSTLQKRSVPHTTRHPQPLIIMAQNLDALIAHTRTYDIFPLFSARIALHHAHLAHALARPARALRCYHAAAQHSDPGSFVNLAARAGEAALCVGVHRRRTAMGDGWRQGLSATDDGWPDGYDNWELVEARGKEVLKACRGMGGALEAIAQVLEACFTPEILKSKYVEVSLSVSWAHGLYLASRVQATLEARAGARDEGAGQPPARARPRARVGALSAYCWRSCARDAPDVRAARCRARCDGEGCNNFKWWRGSW